MITELSGSSRHVAIRTVAKVLASGLSSRELVTFIASRMLTYGVSMEALMRTEGISEISRCEGSGV